MNEPFGSLYADCYDALYRDKDYGAECDLVERLFKSYGDGAIRSVLDLGCGTGNHALQLAGKGLEVVGVDRSAAMLAQARRKAAAAGAARIEFHQFDIRTAELGRRFDAVLMMFAVLSYQPANDDVLGALRAARRHLNPGGLFLFDVWYGPAVLAQRPSERIKEIPTPDGKILRVTSGELDTSRQSCTVRYRLRKFAAGKLPSEADEEHRVRYFFPFELKLCLESAGFSLLRLGAFLEFEREPDEKTWNVLAMARAI